MDRFHHIVPGLASRGRIALGREALERWGEEFGRAARAPLVVTLAGELGAGKTTLAQAICRAYGATDVATSPTYAIVHEYAGGPTPVYHLDLYRLESLRELEQLGWDDIISAPALVLVEWPERAGDLVPPAHVPIALEHVAGDDARRVLLAG